MQTMYLFSVFLLGPADAPASDTAQVAALVAAGEAHLRRAMDADDHPPDEFEGAHKNFEAAYLAAQDPQYLCRALAAAELALLSVKFSDDQERLSWEELRLEDLNRLQEDAREKKRANCRFDAEGNRPPPRVAILDDADLPEPDVPSAGAPPAHASTTPTSPTNSSSTSGALAASASEPPKPNQATTRSVRAKTVSGSIFTAAGIGLLAGSAAVVGFGVLQRGWEMEELVGSANAEQRKFTPAEYGRFNELRAELLHGRDVAIGVGVAGLVSLGTGIALLVTRKKAPRARGYALHPYGGPRGAGAVLRLAF
ncbi:hypothetical protein [Nannocystis pusilla]|uniref:Uncharacterized protein n=1 Tax=Nannocystis pusilla TaxID=889268 RepID=A0ABS7TN49_9BACT|nr:hypothetical protein [Nannocystis pusilla]MBZ5709632.1 hypothetical protein [Nannocystis pusilla]